MRKLEGLFFVGIGSAILAVVTILFLAGGCAVGIETPLTKCHTPVGPIWAFAWAAVSIALVLSMMFTITFREWLSRKP